MNEILVQFECNIDRIGDDFAYVSLYDVKTKQRLHATMYLKDVEENNLQQGSPFYMTLYENGEELKRVEFKNISPRPMSEKRLKRMNKRIDKMIKAYGSLEDDY